MGRRAVWAAAVACLVAAGPLGASTQPHAVARPAPLLVGIADDHSKWLARPDGLLAKYRDLGLGAVRVTIGWRRGQTRPNRLQGLYVHRAASLVARGQRVVVAVFGLPSEAPITSEHRRQYCDFLHYVLLRVPFRDVQIWNEANSPRFWPRSAGASAYEALLAACWRRLHALRRDVNVISTTAARHDPAQFMRDLGSWYRARSRPHPLVDTFGHNPYPSNSSEPPWVRHEDPRTVGQGDLDRLLGAIETAFAGTAQPLPGQAGTRVWYLETGFQTTVPPAKRRYYHGVETDRFAVSPLATKAAAPWAPDHGRQLRDALLLASCQAAVGAFFNFELLDEDRLSGWQSGLLWRDGTHKPAYASFKAAIELVRSGRVDCATVPGAGDAVRPLDSGRTPADRAQANASVRATLRVPPS